MPVSLSDFCGQVSSHVAASGAVFKTAMNADGSVQISRAPSAASGAWAVLHSRVIHNVTTDTVFVSDGTGGSMPGAGSASVFIAGLK
jgi:hypothetical protein